MNSAWTKGLRKGSQEDKDIRALYAESFILRKRLLTILQDKFDIKVKAAMNSDNFDSPSWAYVQAESIGYAKALKEIMTILDASDKKDEK